MNSQAEHHRPDEITRVCIRRTGWTGNPGGSYHAGRTCRGRYHPRSSARWCGNCARRRRGSKQRCHGDGARLFTALDRRRGWAARNARRCSVVFAGDRPAPVIAAKLSRYFSCTSGRRKCAACRRRLLPHQTSGLPLTRRGGFSSACSHWL